MKPYKVRGRRPDATPIDRTVYSLGEAKCVGARMWRAGYDAEVIGPDGGTYRLVADEDFTGRVRWELVRA